MTTKIKIGEFNYGTTDVLTEDEINLVGAKVRISMMIDLDLQSKLKEISATQHKGYQTLIQEVLREYVQKSAPKSQEQLFKSELEHMRNFVRKLVIQEVPAQVERALGKSKKKKTG